LPVIGFILTILIPALFELKRPKDAGPRIVSKITPEWKVWCVRIRDMEPFIPDMAAEESGETNNKIFGLEKLSNIEVVHQQV